jgi:hypothetical protein
MADFEKLNGAYAENFAELYPLAHRCCACPRALVEIDGGGWGGTRGGSWRPPDLTATTGAPPQARWGLTSCRRYAKDIASGSEYSGVAEQP